MCFSLVLFGFCYLVSVQPLSFVLDGASSVTAVSAHDSKPACLVVVPFAHVFAPIDERRCVLGVIHAEQHHWGAIRSEACAVAYSVEVTSVGASVSVRHACLSPDRIVTEMFLDKRVVGCCDCCHCCNTG